MKRDIAAGALLVNSIPHTVMGLAGKRCLTPLGGDDSSAGLNLVWAAINCGVGASLLASSRWHDQAGAGERLRNVEVGMFAMTAFGMVYEMTAGRRKASSCPVTGR